MERQHVSGYSISDDKASLDLTMVHRYLSDVSYWAKGIPYETVVKFVCGSMCFGVYTPERLQVGFSRVISDGATFGYLADVFILPEYRGLGLSQMMMQFIMEHPELQGLRRWMLITQDAHGLYSQFGFTPLKHPERAMEQVQPNPYKQM